MAMTAEAIIFAINSAIRLGRNAQRAYAKSLTSKSIVLPLPKFSGTPNAFTAQNFFDNTNDRTGGAQYLPKMERLRDIHHRFKYGLGDEVPTDAELELYVEAYAQLSTVLEHETQADFQSVLDDRRINSDELVALLSIRQYTFDRSKHTKPLQMVAGTLVEIGIDYFNGIPGALNEQSATGRALKHFLRAFDEMDFSDNLILLRQSRKIVPQLFIAAAETISDLGPEITNDPKIQAFVQAAGKSIAADLFERLDQISDSDNQDEAVKWGRFLLRSTVANAGSYVFSAPRQFFDTNSGASELIKATSSVLLDAILQDPDRLDIKGGLNVATLDRLLQTSFSVIAEHPQLIQNKNGFKEIVVGVSTILKDYDFRRADLFPELVRLILEQTGHHLLLFRQYSSNNNAGQEFLLKALQLILEELSAPIPGTNWKPRLSKAQLLYLSEQLLEAVVRNPGWIEHEVQDKPLLALVLRTTFDSLANFPADDRLNATTLEWLLELNLRTVAANELVLQHIHWSSNEQEKMVLQQAITLVFSFVFEQENTTPGDRYQLLAELLDYALDVIVSRYPDQRGILLLDLVLSANSSIDYSGGFDRELANDLQDAALLTLAAHPDLISKKAALGQIVAGIAASLDASSFQRPHILLELVRLALSNAALNTQLLIPANQHEPGYLLVIFIRELLLSISNKEGALWQPQLTPVEALAIIDAMMEALIEHPEWIIKDTTGQILFQDVFIAVRNALRNLPEDVHLSPELLQYLFALAMHTAATSQAVLDKIPWGSDAEKRSILERALALVSTFVFHELQVSGGERLQRFAELVEYVMEVILIYHPDKKGLLLIDLILFSENDIDYSIGFDDALLTDIIEASLRVFEQHPGLISQERAIQSIISDLAGSLSHGHFRQKGVLPDLLRLTLEATALNAQLLIGGTADSPRFLISMALQSLLQHLSRTDEEGQWSPKLTGDDIFLLAESLLDEVVEHPHWIIPSDQFDDSIWNQVLAASLDALAQLPANMRISPATLENLIILSLQTAAASPQILHKIQWGSDEDEKAILNRILDLLIPYVFPAADPSTSARRVERFLELLDFVLEVIINKYPDKRALLLVELLFFESEVDLSQGFDTEMAHELIYAGIGILDAHPELVTEEEVFQKILRDTAQALRAAKTEIDHLWPEFIRLVLHHGAGHLERLMRISPYSPRILLVVAFEQVLRVATQPPPRGHWRPNLTDKQLLEVVEIVLAKVIERPEWINREKQIQTTLEAIFIAIGELKSDQSLPYETISFLVSKAMEAVSIRQHLILTVVRPDGEEEQLILLYTLSGIFLELYNKSDDTPGSWTLTETETLHNLLSAVLMRLAAGPADQLIADQLLNKIRQAVRQINDNLNFALDDLLSEITTI